MSRILLVLWACSLASSPTLAQETGRRDGTAASPDETAIRQQLKSYVDAFNRHDAAEIAKFWSNDCVSLADDSGERIEGRAALQQHFADFFEDTPTAHLSGEVSEVRIIRPDVAVIGGETTLLVADGEPIVSTFSSVLVKEGDAWLISNSHEHDLTATETARKALLDLDWLVGDWQDQTGDTQVSTTFRWARNQAFLIRSFTVQSPDAEPLEGTQVIGWDPLNQQIRSWTFDSDGSFGEGTISRHDDAWLLKMWQLNAAGELASATQVITRIDADTMQVQIIGETVDGEPSSASDPVTVTRINMNADDAAAPASNEQGEKP